MNSGTFILNCQYFVLNCKEGYSLIKITKLCPQSCNKLIMNGCSYFKLYLYLLFLAQSYDKNVPKCYAKILLFIDTTIAVLQITKTPFLISPQTQLFPPTDYSSTQISLHFY